MSATARAKVADEQMPSMPAGSPAHRLRVLQVVNWFGLGGAERGICKVANALGEEFEHQVCGVRGADQDFAAKAGLEPPLIAAAGKGSRFSVLSLAKVMRAYRPHIVHSRNWGAIESVFAARIAGVPVAIHSEHGYELDILHGLPTRQRLYRRAAYAAADAVFAVTSDLRDYHARQAWIPRRRIGVIHNGVDTVKFAPDARVGRLHRAELGIATDAFVVGTVGRLVPIKDHGTLIDAFARFSLQGSGAVLLIVGSGPEEQRLRQLASAGGLAAKIRFVSASPHVHELLNAFDVFVLPSINEGMSNTLLEAMACALPVIATNVGGNPEVVGDAGGGFLVPPADGEAIAGRLAQLQRLPDLRAAMGSAARQRIVESFSLAAMTRAYRELYLGLAQRRGLLDKNKSLCAE